ncbi:DUF6988 family protein [Acinetobacter guillouiae]|uniref:DUF6988 family protein n=1 Tax=Acinetobacter guillouiae TaxID=106649 RepID=UPI003AF8D5A0
MDKLKLFESSLEMIGELKTEIICSDVVDCGPRLELVEECIYISFDHGIGVNNLLANDLPIQAMILFRAQFESVVRAYWLMFIASNDDVLKLKFNWTNDEQEQKEKYPMASQMLTQLNNIDDEVKSIIVQLMEFKAFNINALNSFVHTGKHSFTRSAIGFEHKFLLQIMRMANNLVSTAAQLMLKHTKPDKQKFLKMITKKYRECFFLIEDLNATTK